MQTQVSPRRRATPARWQKALQRAFDQHVTVYQLQCGVWVATSGTDRTAAYAVTLDDCECRAAAEGDECCKHRAALRHHLGSLTLPDPTPEPVPAPRMMTCPMCKGTKQAGYRDHPKAGRITRGGPASGLYQPCDCPRCHGTGNIPVPTAPPVVIQPAAPLAHAA